MANAKRWMRCHNVFWGGSILSQVAPNLAWSFDASGQVAITLPINATFDIPAGDGLISVVDNGGIAAGVFFAVYGTTALLSGINASAVIGTANNLNFFYNAATATRRFENKTGSTLNLNITGIRTR